MDAYTDFAGVYDTFMDETPYREWAEYLSFLIEKYGVSKPQNETAAEHVTAEKTDAAAMEAGQAALSDRLNAERNLVVDLGCGTGTLTGIMTEMGYDMVGIDNAEEMLSIAMEKRDRAGWEILYLLQDMRELELYCTAGTIISVCDSLNYLLTEEDLLQTFRRVNNYLYPGGIFIFDFNTVYKYEEVIGDTTIAENRDACSFIWENYYHEDEQINEYDLTIFTQEENGLYRRFEETHYQRGYTLSMMLALIEKAGMEFVAAVDADTHGEVTEISERIYVVAREHGK